MRRLAAALALLAAAGLAAAGLAGCASTSQGGGASASAQRSDRLVDFSKKPPYVNALDYDAKKKRFLLTTNKGFWAIDSATGKVTQIKGQLSYQGKTDTVGTFLEIEPLPDGTFLGSGHPDHQNTLPQFLGFLKSTDEGQTWQALARVGDADLHKIIPAHGKIYAFDAVLGAMLISADGGRTFQERFTPRGLVIDFVVDPNDANFLIAATEDQVYRTEDGGNRWRPLDNGFGTRLVWPEPARIVRADKDGTIKESTDRGATWRQIGKLDGEPYKFETTDEPNHLYLAVSDGTIFETVDGGKTWKVVFKP
jgi:hypothetical protein